jgi:hypothetical protein
MAYGILKVDTITFTDAGVDKSVTISGLVQNPTFSGNITVTGTVSGNTIQGQTVSGVTVTGGAAAFTTVTGGVATITSGVFALGSASNPSISFTGDANSGLYSPGADQVAISTGGSGRLFVDANGNIAIGTSATSNFGATARSFDINSAGGIANLYVKTGTVNGGLQADAGNGYMQVWTASNHPIAFNIAFSEKMRLDTSGRLGIGTSAPGSYWAGVDNLVIADSGDAGLAIKSGTGNYGTIAFTDTVSTTNEGYIQYDHNLNSLKFGTNSTNALFIDSSQRVGIGTTSVQSPLDVTATGISGTTTNDGIRIYAANRSQYANFGYDGFNTTFSSLKFAIADAERARIDSSGRLLVGTSSTSQLFSGVALTGVQIEKSGNSATRSLALVSNASVNFPPTLSLCRSQGTSNGSVTSVASGDNLGTIRWGGADGTTAFIDAASITCEVDGTPGTNDMPGRLTFSTTADGASSPTERLRIDSSGRVGIGTTSPLTKFVASNGGAEGIELAPAYSAGNNFTFHINRSGSAYVTNSQVASAHIFRISSDATEAARIDSSGRLLIGTSTARSNIFGITPYFQLEGANSNSNRFASLTYGQNDPAGGAFSFNKHRGNAVGGNTIVQNGDALGGVNFTGADGTNFIVGASVKAEVDGTPGANDMPGRLLFSTTSDGASSPTERLRITSAGLVGVGTTSPSAILHAVAANDPVLFLNRSASDGEVARFLVGGNTAFSFSTTAGGIRTIDGGNADFRIRTNSADRLTVTSTGNVGVGTTSAGANLDLAGTTSRIRWDVNNAYTLQTHGNAAFSAFASSIQNAADYQFQIAGSERARIDSSGRLGIGTSSPSQVLTTVGNIKIAGAQASNNAKLCLTRTDRSWSIANETDLRFYYGAGDTDSPATPVVTFTAGRVGIGTTSPAGILDIDVTGDQLVRFQSTATMKTRLVTGNSDVSAIEFSDQAAYRAKIQVETSDAISFYTGGITTEAARLDSSGRLLVGTSSTNGSFNSAIQIAGSGVAATQLISRFDNDAGAPNFYFAKSRGASVNTNTLVQSGDEVGVIGFYAADGTNYVPAAQIRADIDGTPGTNDMPGRLVFATTADGASGPTERMRILSTGETRIPAAYTITTANAANVYVFADGALARSTSSQKYKTQVEPIEYRYSTALLGCEPVWYRSTCDKDNGNWGWWGFIAEEVAKIDPRLVHWKTTEPVVQENGSIENVPCEPEPEGVAYDRFVPHLLNLIKRQQQAIETLQAKVAALEAP